MTLTDEFTSTGSKFWNHPEALEGLRNGKPRPVVSHIMLTDVCNHKCAMCSVQSRDGQSLAPDVVRGYVEQLKPLGLKAVILSGGGNPILYKNGGWDFNDAVDYLHGQGLEIGLITNGMPLVDYTVPLPSVRTPENKEGYSFEHTPHQYRKSWKTVHPKTLDKLTWVRISMAGLDHKENEVFVPDIDHSKTTLGFSYVAHDIYEMPVEPYHGKVSTLEDVESNGGMSRVSNRRMFEDRIPELTRQIGDLVRKHKPRYARVLPNCLQPPLIAKRCEQLQAMADAIDPSVVMVQYKPPAAPPNCFLGYLHPVLNCDAFVYPCDSCVLQVDAHHKFAVPWRVCRWDEIGALYSQPARSLIKDTKKLCPQCVFTKSNLLLQGVVDGAPLQPPSAAEHRNFI